MLKIERYFEGTSTTRARIGWFSGGGLSELCIVSICVEEFSHLAGSRPGIDPNAFERESAEVSARHDIVNIELDCDISHRADAKNLFYPVHGHLTEEGNTVYEQALTRGLP